MKKMWILVFCAALAFPMGLSSRDSAPEAAPDVTIEIVTFMIERYSDGANIVWKVMHNGEVQTYFLQHSTNQLDWSTIAEITPNMGEEFDTQDYFHSNLEDGTHYYRLLARLVTGQEEISKALIFHVNIDQINGVSGSSPTTVNYGNTLSLTSGDQDENAEFEIRDELGNVVWRVPLALEVDLSHLKPGVYYIRETQSGEVQRVIKL